MTLQVIVFWNISKNFVFVWKRALVKTRKWTMSHDARSMVLYILYCLSVDRYFKPARSGRFILNFMKEKICLEMNIYWKKKQNLVIWTSTNSSEKTGNHFFKYFKEFCFCLKTGFGQDKKMDHVAWLMRYPWYYTFYIVYRSTGISNQPVVADLNWILFMKKSSLKWIFIERKMIII